MKRRQTLPESIVALAGTQGNAISRAQLDAHGVGEDTQRRMLADGTLRMITRGVYALDAPTWLTRAWAGLLIAGPQGVLGGTAALYLLGLASPPAVIDIYVPHGIKRRAAGPWRFNRSTRRGSGRPPVTGMGQALVDATADMTETDAINLILRASRRADRQNLVRLLTARKHHPHRKLLLEVVRGTPGVESVLELRYLHDVERAHGLPRAKRQVFLEDGRRCDVFYEDYELVVELDGAAWHTGARRDQDMMDDNRQTALGTLTLRYAWAHVVGDPCAVARQVANVLTKRGWTGHMDPCPRCS